MEFRNHIESLKKEQDSLESLEKDYKRNKEIFETENAKLLENIKNVKLSIEQDKKAIEEIALQRFKEDNTTKKFFGGIGIQERKTLEYDEDKALQFAKQKDMFLMLDKKSFEKVADSLNLDFVKSDTKTTVTFPKEIKLEG